MESLGALVFLACPIGMGLMMWFMARGTRKEPRAPRGASVEQLREEHRRLGAELERVEAREREPVAGR